MFPAFPNVPGAAATDNVPGTEVGLTMRIALSCHAQVVVVAPDRQQCGSPGCE